MRRNKGSITVFLSLIIVIVMAFIGGLIDGSRMRTAETQVNRAVDNGTKSILASYDEDLKDIYGLFAFAGDEAVMQATVLDVIKDNLIVDSEGDTKYVDLYDYSIGELSIGMKGPLTQVEILKEQILQNMKYRAPFNLAEGIITKLDLFKDMSKYSDTLKKKEDLDKKVKKIDKKLEELNKKGADVQELVNKIKEYGTGDGTGDPKKFSDISKFIYIKEVLNTIEEEQVNSAEKLSLGSLTIKVDNGKVESVKEIKGKLNELKSELKKFNSVAAEAQELIAEAQPQFNAYKDSNDALSTKTSASSQEGIGQNIDTINNGFEAEFKEYEKIFGKDSTMEKNLKIANDDLVPVEGLITCMSEFEIIKIGETFKTGSVGNKEKGEAKQLNNKEVVDYAAIIKHYNSNMNDSKVSMDPNKLKEVKRIETNIATNLANLKNLEKEVIETEEDEAGLKDTAESLKEKKEKSLIEGESEPPDKTISLSGLPSGNTSTENFILFEGDAAIAGEDNSNMETSLNAMDALEAAGDALLSVRDELYINEYVMTRLKDRVVGEDPTLAKNRVPQMANGFDSALNYEIEYVLAGNASDNSNKNNVWWKMYATRVLSNAITIRGIPNCKTKIDRMARLTQAAIAAAFGGLVINLTILKALYTAAWVAIESKADMDLLVGGHKVPLYKKDWNYWLTQDVVDPSDEVKNLYDTSEDPTDKLLSTIYSDYLRLFLLLQPQATTIARLEDIIHVNMKIKSADFDLSKAMTQVNVNGEVSIKYMFFNLPMMFEKNKESGRYKINVNKSLGF